MATIGTYDGLVFQASSKKTALPDNISAEWSGRWSSVETPGNVPQSEFLGPGIGRLSFDMTFRADMGIKPENQLRMIRQMVEDGNVSKLYMGGKPVGKLPWAIKSVSEKWNVITSNGKIYAATVSVELEEYR